MQCSIHTYDGINRILGARGEATGKIHVVALIGCRKRCIRTMDISNLEIIVGGTYSEKATGSDGDMLPQGDPNDKRSARLSSGYRGIRPANDLRRLKPFSVRYLDRRRAIGRWK